MGGISVIKVKVVDKSIMKNLFLLVLIILVSPIALIFMFKYIDFLVGVLT